MDNTLSRHILEPIQNNNFRNTDIHICIYRNIPVARKFLDKRPF